MKQRYDLEVSIHYMMAVCGGIFGAYALFGRMAVFGSAQTANLIELMGDIVGRNFGEAVLRAGALLIYGGSMVTATILAKKTKLPLKYTALILEAAVAVVLACIPESVNPIIALYPAFFMTAFQWCVFTGAKGYASSTIFSTNNVKQTFVSATEYFLSDDPEEKRKKAEKAKFFGGTLIAFHIGVAAEYALYQMLHLQSILIVAVPLTAAAVLLAAADGKIKSFCMDLT